MAATVVTSLRMPIEISDLNEPKVLCDTEDEITETPSILILEDNWVYHYGPGEVIWGILLIIGIFGVNLWILWIVSHTRDLWKPRHLWMACLCVTDLFVGVHKIFELLLLVLPGTLKHLCIINKAMLGIPYILNILLLTLLSLDRFIAVCYPFFYTSIVSNKHVGLGFLLVIVTGCILSSASIAVGLHDVICRVHCLQLRYLTITLSICSILTLFFNTSVLRIAKKQLNAIYAKGAAMERRRVSVICVNCGHKNEAIISTVLTIPISLPKSSAEFVQDLSPEIKNELLPITDTEGNTTSILVEEAHQSCVSTSCQESNSFNLNLTLEETTTYQSLNDETTSPLVRTTSLPTFSDITPGAGVISTEIENGFENFIQNPLDIKNGIGVNSSPTEIQSSTTYHSSILPRCRSLFSCSTLIRNANSHLIHVPIGTRIQLFRNIHFARMHMFHIGRLFPSIRFARTVLLIMIPMWIFILPIITIIPLHRSCKDGTTKFGCSVVETLWTYLLVHIRSILPLQAILDTLIYACGSKEFKHALQKSFWNNGTKKF